MAHPIMSRSWTMETYRTLVFRLQTIVCDNLWSVWGEGRVCPEWEELGEGGWLGEGGVGGEGGLVGEGGGWGRGVGWGRGGGWGRQCCLGHALAKKKDLTKTEANDITSKWKTVFKPWKCCSQLGKIILWKMRKLGKFWDYRQLLHKDGLVIESWHAFNKLIQN